MNNIIEDYMEVEEVTKKNWASVEIALKDNRANMNDILEAIGVIKNHLSMQAQQITHLQQEIGMLRGTIAGHGSTTEH